MLSYVVSTVILTFTMARNVIIYLFGHLFKHFLNLFRQFRPCACSCMCCLQHCWFLRQQQSHCMLISFTGTVSTHVMIVSSWFSEGCHSNGLLCSSTCFRGSCSRLCANAEKTIKHTHTQHWKSSPYFSLTHLTLFRGFKDPAEVNTHLVGG